MKRVLAITAALAALMLAGCEPYEFYEEENKKISSALIDIANAALWRGCTSDIEVGALKRLNSILEERKSKHRIVMWELPTRQCSENKGG
jgi:hypothetical protein